MTNRKTRKPTKSATPKPPEQDPDKLEAEVATAPPPPAKTNELGLACTKCGCRHFLDEGDALQVYYTRKRRNAIARVRRCRNCGKRVSTRETVVGN